MCVLILSGAIPLALGFAPPLKLYRHARALFYSIALIVVIFGAWDVYATSRGHWCFNPSGVLPLRIINLPIEEVLFFIVIPFCCIFTWEALLYLKERLL
jgi:lycopene cyclase domain-containing protein